MEKFAKLIFGKRKAGFTMVELIVVIVILAAITTAAVPGFIASLRRAKFEKTVEEIVVLLEKARTQALASELDSAQKIPSGGYGVFFDFTSLVPPTDQKAVLFVDDWNADPDEDGDGSDAAAVNINYADEDIANRILPDGKYTEGGDSELAVVTINDPKYIRIESLSGTKLADSSAWDHALDNEIVVIFEPPFAETKITGCNSGNPDVDLQKFEVEIELITEDISRTIRFNRITTTPQVIEN
ncbi:prepilin-type N-terminal cleavage/methylation domain-containing protein [Patescibacteria group bacterium]|nr:prepilin-type N-terminal cleavage/methylation domain-containing protein [Patescibacteria group bacterium]